MEPLFGQLKLCNGKIGMKNPESFGKGAQSNEPMESTGDIKGVFCRIIQLISRMGEGLLVEISKMYP